jgi:hypothetical protein
MEFAVYTPETHFFESVKFQRLGWSKALSELIDNSLDAVPNKRDQAKDVAKGKPAVQEAVRESSPPKPKKHDAEPKSKTADGQFVKEFLALWARCDEVAKAAIRAFILEDN